MSKKKVSLRPVVDAIEHLLKELEEAADPTDAKALRHTKALKATLQGASLLLQSECWNRDATDAVYEFPA